jgi:type I restriction enzyme S subunit
MSFRIGTSVDPEKVFLVRRSVTAGRLDPAFHRPYFRRRHAQLDGSAFPILSIGSFKGRIFQGVGRNLVEGAPTQLLKVKNITTDGQIDFSETEAVAEVPKSKLLKPGDIISPFIGAAIKGYKFAEFRGSEQPYTVDNNTGVIRITDDRINSEFLHTFFQTALVRWQLDQLTGGGGVPFLGAEYARRIRVPVPPNDVQATAIKMLHKAERRRKNAIEEARVLLLSVDDVLLGELGIRRGPEPANTIESRIFRRAFSKVTGNRLDAHYHRPAFESLMAELRSHPHAILGKVVKLSSELWDQKSQFVDVFPYIEIGSVDLAMGRLTTPPLVPIAEAASRARMMIRPGDLLVSLTRPTRRAICIVPDSLPLAVASNGFSVVRSFDETLIVSRYLLHVLRSRLCTAQFDQRSSGGNYPAITEEQLLKLIIPLPKTDIQTRIVNLLDKQYEKADSMLAVANIELEHAKDEIEALVLGNG